MENIWKKKKVDIAEYNIYKQILELKIINVPEIILYDEEDKVLYTREIKGDNLSNIYGDQATDVPINIYKECRRIIGLLRKNGIEYPDITGYNFILENDTEKIWLIDFEHAYNLKSKNTNYFVDEFCNFERQLWNPDFE